MWLEPHPQTSPLASSIQTQAFGNGNVEGTPLKIRPSSMTPMLHLSSFSSLPFPSLPFLSLPLPSFQPLEHWTSCKPTPSPPVIHHSHAMRDPSSIQRSPNSQSCTLEIKVSQSGNGLCVVPGGKPLRSVQSSNGGHPIHAQTWGPRSSTLSTCWAIKSI